MKGKRFRIFDIAGFPVYLDLSWFVTFIGLGLLLAFSYLPGFYGPMSVQGYLVCGFLASLLTFGSVLVHELGHAVVSRRFGIQIKSIRLFIFGGLAVMEREPSRPHVEMLIAVAGPLTNLLIGILLWVIFPWRALSGSVAAVMMQYLVVINLGMALFNLLPGFPMDGGRILRAILWHFNGNYKKSSKVSSQIGRVFAFVVIVFASLEMVIFITNWQVQSLFNAALFAFMGMFLVESANSSYARAVYKSALEEMQVSDIMTFDVPAVPHDITIEAFLKDIYYKASFGGYPVLDGGRLIGILCYEDIQTVPSDKRLEFAISEFMRPVGDTLSKHEQIASVLKKMVQSGAKNYVVIDDNGTAIGMVSDQDIIRLLRIRNTKS